MASGAESSAEELCLVVPKAAKSPMWEHFGFEIETKSGKKLDDKHVKCKHCHQNVAYSGNTSNMRQHLTNHHPHLLSSPSGVSKTKQTTLDSFATRPISLSSKRGREITGRIAEFIAKDLRPVAVVEGEGFKALLGTLEPGYTVPSRKHVMTVLKGMKEEVMTKVQQELDAALYVSLTTDFWTSHAVKSYLGVTSHFLTPDWKLTSRVLQTREVEESHTSATISHELQSVAIEWSVQEKLAATTTDNARNIVGGVRQLHWQHIPCFAHTLNISVRDGLNLPVISDMLSKCRKLVGHFKHSYIAQTALEVKQEEYNLPKHKLVQEVATRWNSAYEMLERIIEQETAVSAVLLASKKAHDRDLVLATLTSTEISKMRSVVAILKPFAQASAMLGAEQIPTMSVVQPMLKALLRKHLTESEEDGELIGELKRTISASLKAHFNDKEQQKHMRLASVLDPRFKSLKFLLAAERVQVYSDLLQLASTFSDPQENPVEAPLPKRHKGSDLLDFSESSGSNGSSPHPDPSSDLEKEVDRYKAEEQIERSKDPFEWWQLHEHQYKTLARVARKLLCIQATSVPSERLFSTAGVIVSKLRSALSPDSVDMLLFLHKNL